MSAVQQPIIEAEDGNHLLARPERGVQGGVIVDA